MIDSLNQIFLYLNESNNSFYVFVAYLGLCTFGLLLRLIVFIGYQSQYSIFKLKSKSIKTLADIKESKFGLFNKVIKDYIQNSKKGSTYETKRLVERHIVKLDFLGISLTSLSGFTKSFEQSMLFVGLILCFVFEDYRFTFAVSAVAVFLVLKLLFFLLDTDTLVLKFSEELCDYVDREIGQFFSGEFVPVVNRLKAEFTSHLDALKDALLPIVPIAEMLAKQSEYIEKNQALINESLMAYQTALQNITSELGNGLSGIVDFQLTQSTEKLNNELKSNIERAMNVNNNLVNKLSKLFETLSAQSKTETKAYMQLKDRIEVLLKGDDYESV